MHEQKTSTLRFHYWSQAALWTGFIYITLYLVRPICRFLQAHTPFQTLIFILMLVILGSLTCVFFRKNHVITLNRVIFFGAVLLCYAFGMFLVTIPEERVHFLQYGLMAFFIYRASILDLKHWQGIVFTLILTALAGLGDECIQHILPNRYFQWKDVLLNAVSGALGLGMTLCLRVGQTCDGDSVN
ncbi:MAG: VanZ family protein [Candidatus Omnitrophica bacterium]|nr:VanZ family protein [Candidatus Omnitrophota bacterium]